MTAAEQLGGADESELEARRARIAVAEAAEVLATVCRDRRAAPEAVAAAERRVAQAFARFGGLMLAAAAALRSIPR